jgi:hypothetical protein
LAWLFGVSLGKRKFLATGFYLAGVFWSATFLRDFCNFLETVKSKSKKQNQEQKK